MAFGVSLTKVTRDVEVQVLCKIILSDNMTSHLSFCDMTLSPIPGRMLERLNEKYQTATLLLRQTLQLFVLTWVVVLVTSIIPFHITKLYRNQCHCQSFIAFSDVGTLATTETRADWPRKVLELILDSDSRESRGRPKGLKGPRGKMGGPIGSQEVEGVGIQGPWPSRVRPTGSQGVKG